MESSIYRRDVNGQIFGADEAKSVANQPQAMPQGDEVKPSGHLNEPEVVPRIEPKFVSSKPEPVAAPPIEPQYPNANSPVIQRPPMPKPQSVKSKSAGIRKPKLNVELIKSDFAKIDWSKFKDLDSIKKFISGKGSTNKTPMGRVTFYAKRILIFYIVFFIFLGLKSSFGLNKIDATPKVQIENTAGTNWLLIGSDSREGLTPEEEQQMHTGQDEGAQRTDTIMIVHIGKSGVTLVSLPRDSYISIPEHVGLDGNQYGVTKNKINCHIINIMGGEIFNDRSEEHTSELQSH